MKNMAALFLVLVSFLASVSAYAKDYQVTGNVTEVTDKKIVVVKGKENFEIARDANTKLKGEPKVGSKATVYYSMTASEIEVKEEKAKK